VFEIHTIAVSQKLETEGLSYAYNPYFNHAGFQVLVMVTDDCWFLGCDAMLFGGNLLFQSSMLPSPSGWKHTLKMKTTGSSETLVNFCQSTWHYIPGDNSLTT
jgi:hypothetical protein